MPCPLREGQTEKPIIRHDLGEVYPIRVRFLYQHNLPVQLSCLIEDIVVYFLAKVFQTLGTVYVNKDLSISGSYSYSKPPIGIFIRIYPEAVY